MKMCKIMVVDDESAIIMQLEERLRTMGYEVVGTAASGQEAVDKARRLAPDVILMDIVMPGKLDGIEAAEAIRAEMDVPVLFVTGYAEDEFVGRAKGVEPFGYIVKPFHESEIKATIEVALHNKTMERRLQQSEAELRLFRTLLDQSRDAIYVMEPETGRFLDVNEQACRGLGYTRAELLDMAVTDIEAIIPDKLSWETHVAQVREQGWRVLLGERKRKDGATFPVEVQVSIATIGSQEYMTAVVRDITERQQAETRIRDLARIPAENPNPVLRVGGNGVLTYCNEASEPLLAAWGCKVGGRLPDPLAAVVGKARESGRPEQAEVSVPDRTYLVCAAPVGDDRSANVYAIEITERKQMEERLRHTEKMDAIGQLAGGVAHDFNNQLAGIMGFACLLQERVKDEKLRNYADTIVRLCEQSKDLTGKLLAFSRGGKYEIAPVDIHELVAEVVSILEHSIDKRVRIKQLLEASPSVTAGAAGQLQNSLLNLALNARDAMPNGGELTLRTDMLDLDETFCRQHPGATPGRHLRISVTDTGVGMDQKTQKRMFEPFFTTKPQGEGTGMGLASVYGTVVNHHGAIEVESEVGRGAAVTIYLPLAEVPEQKKTETAVRTASPRPDARILLVDDEEPIRVTTSEMLRNRGFRVDTCRDGDEAVDCYRKSWQHIDLVILDMAMPAMDGRDAFIAMRRINPEVKAILATGYSLDCRSQEILDQGVRAFIQKPFHIDQLVETVTRTLGT